MSRTPCVDAVQAWLDAGDLTAPIDWPAEDFDPCAGMTGDERADYAIAHAASGAPAVLPPRYVRINGRLIPPPPTGVPTKPFRHGRRNHAPRPRKVRTP